MNRGGPAFRAKAPRATPRNHTASYAEGETPAQAAVQPFLPGAEATCAGQEEGTSCWMELASHPGCYVWNPFLGENETASWSGGCSGGLAHDTGTLIFNISERTQECTGLLQGGKMYGRWVVRSSDGDSSEGPLVDGKKHGRWVERSAKGWVSKGLYVDGKKNGRWVVDFGNGDTTTLNYGNEVSQQPSFYASSGLPCLASSSHPSQPTSPNRTHGASRRFCPCPSSRSVGKGHDSCLVPRVS